jgi:hypothetical protein
MAIPLLSCCSPLGTGAPFQLNYSWVLSLMLRQTVSRPVRLGIKHPSGAYDQIFIIVWQLRVCWYGAPSLTRGRVCRLRWRGPAAIVVIFGSESRKTRGHILLSQIWDCPLRRLLRLAGLRWRYSNRLHLITLLHGPSGKHRFQQYLFCYMRIRCSGNVFTDPLPRNGSTRYNILPSFATFCWKSSSLIVRSIRPSA